VAAEVWVVAPPRDDEGVSEQGPPGWIVAADAAALRLVAEVGPEVAEVLGEAASRGGSASLLIDQAARLKRSSDLTEVATDLAGLLWAECEDVPPIASILDDPAAQGSLEAVAAARRAGARRIEASTLAPPPARSAAWPASGEAKIWPERSVPVDRPTDSPPGQSPSAGTSGPPAAPGPSPHVGKLSGVPGPAASLFWSVRRRITRPQS